MDNAQRRIYVIESTHWDREWRFSFEATRVRLLRMMDNLLDIVEKNPDHKCYHLDGQAIMLEDYLELRPENARRLKAACRAGKILAGPWYTLPEENLVLGESLVRNFLLGRKACRDFGGAMPVGYSPTSYGQVSQMPQIMAGFGITSILFYRGINNVVTRHAEFQWEGPDGSKLLAFRFSDYGRANFFHLVYRPMVHDRDRSKQEHRWEDGGIPFRLAGASSIQPYELIEPPLGRRPDNAVKAAEALLAELRDNATPLALGMQTQDLLEAYPDLPALIRTLNERVGRELFVAASLPEYVAAIRALNPALETLTGEMRHTQKTVTITDLHPHIFPARAYVKQANRIAELELSRWSEPAAALAWLLDRPYPEPFLTRAWKLLVANHAHDSISGCSMDAVHEDTMCRNRQVRIIAGEQTALGLGRLAAAIDGSALAPEDILFVAFNPEPRPRSEVVAADLDAHVDEKFEAFEIVDEAGRPVPAQVRGEEPKLTIFQSPHELPLRMRTRSRRLYFQADDVPALGYKSWLLRRGGTGSIREGSMAEAGGRALSNGLVRVEVNPNGTWNLADLARGRRFDNLGLLEDDGEVGDPWVRYAPKEERLVTSAACRAEASVAEDGPLSATLSVRFPFRVPACALGFDQKRSEEEVPLEIEHQLTLHAGSRRLEIVTRFDNKANDHRLRISFPTGIRGAAQSAAESAFDVARRDIRVPDGADWREPPSGCHPHLGFVDVSDGQEGLALLNLGIPQYEVRDDEARTLALTFMRCFAQKNTIRRAEYPDQPGSQCLFPQEFRYALVPHAGDWEAAGLLAEAGAFLLPLRVGQAGRNARGALPRSLSFFEASPGILQLSAVKRSEDGRRLVVRLWNPTDRALDGSLRCFRPPKAAHSLTLAEERARKLRVKDGVVLFKVGPKKIVTLGLAL
ncbi:MAG: glycoside hydrolase family 38 C-terminal domain-containing protein [Verrucomicrobiota bacterium]|nr:glycoside hydrolase family 38 C-terminal domain-containing protein [Verrucomicrobiota bacterium]